MKRREFIKVVSVSTSALALAGFPLANVLAQDGPYNFDPANPAISRFPQSVMSGDPTPNSLILWTRVQSTAPSAIVAYQVSKTADFSTILTQGTFTTDSSMDYTVRIKLTGLEAYTFYYYRFIFEQTASKTGRTKTAPNSGDNLPIKFGFMSCQDYTNGFYAALGIMAEENLDFMVHLGDYIYETVGAGFQGSNRTINLPDGFIAGPDYGKAALTLADYRTIYKTYRSDPQMQALNEAFPLIAIWDDHEYSNDAWGATATYFNESKDEFNPTRRKTANKVWFEFMPADIPAYDDSQPYDKSLKIYRNFRFGGLLELIMTDERLYRSDHLIPEGPAIAPIAKPLNSELGSRYFVPRQYFDALEAAKPPISMLGITQKDWFKDKLANSTATWKIWGNEVSLLRMLLDLSSAGATVYYLNLDQWDGYNRERSELMKYISQNNIKNVVAVTGDIHSFFAGKVYENYDDQTKPAVIVDFNGAGVSSTPFYYGLYAPTTIAGSPFAPLEPVLRYNPATDTNGVDTLLKLANPHLKHARSLAYGFSTVTVEANQLRVSFKEVAVDSAKRSIKKVYNFVVPNGTADILPEAGTDLPDSTADSWLAITGFEVDNRNGFLNYWRSYGGLKVFGYPISPVLNEGGRKVQYFERNRFEAFPENKTPYQVQLGLLGNWAAQSASNQAAFAPVAKSGNRFYSETGHNLSPLFQAFWDTNGAIPILGFPTSEQFEEVVEGKSRQTQYFERAVLRSFPENNPDYQVQSDLLGVAYYQSIYFFR